MGTYEEWLQVQKADDFNNHLAFWDSKDEEIKEVWRPCEPIIQQSNIFQLQSKLGFDSYTELYQWSIQNKSKFWSKTIGALNIKFHKEPESILNVKYNPIKPNWLMGASSTL